jgi:hypothetical protein
VYPFLFSSLFHWIGAKLVQEMRKAEKAPITSVKDDFKSFKNDFTIV